MHRCGKKGAAAVFIVLIGTTVIAACTVIGNAVFANLKTAACDAALNIGCRSVLSEFDRRLKNDYQIFAYKNSENDIENKLENYIELNLSECIKPFRAGEVSVRAQNAEYAITKPDIFGEQAVAAGKLCAAGVSYVERRGKAALATHSVKNEAMIRSLPSQGKNLKLINLEGFDVNGAVADKVSNTYFENKYIIETFGSRFERPLSRYAYFDYEVEYILSGKLDEAAGLKHVRERILALREPLNAAHIVADPSKMAAIEKYIATLPPGASVVGTAVIVALWASAESENDVNMLLDGKKVALYKTKQQWALSLENAVKMIFGGENYTEPVDKKGQEYEDYLMMLLYLEDRETKLVRTMDLIQLNLRASYNSSLLLKEFYTGFHVSADVDGREYSYVHTY